MHGCAEHKPAPVAAAAPQFTRPAGVLRVCADPNNLPFSNERGEGFENKLAELLAQVHTVQHLSFLISALLFWWALIHGRQGAMGYGAAVLYVFTTSVHSGVLGALLTVAGSVWYPSYAGLTNSWGLTPLEDQQLGGLIMWIPASLVYVVAGLALFAG